MTRLFRSRSCGFGRTTVTSVFDLSPRTPSPSPYLNNDELDTEEEEDEEDEEEERGEAYFENNKPITTPFISGEHRQQQQGGQFPILAILGAALRKSLVTCSVETQDDAPSLEIGRPTNVRHVSHVTFDRFNGFLGLPLDLQPDLPFQVPSASASVFGVSAKSMQCCYDRRGNSVPTILLMMQKHLYSGGGLQAEGIFRINAENGQEEYVRNQLNKGFVPRGIDVHCLAGLIKAWFRELPTGVLDSLTPEQVMHCNTEEECTLLVKLLPQTEAALLDWAINLMADVVQHEHHNKMNARNIAMVFAPNMTQMADPLTALIHAVQVMNFLKTLITQTLREREESSATVWFLSSCPDSPSSKADLHSSNSNTVDILESETEEKFWSFESKSVAEEEYGFTSGRSSPVMCKRKSMGNDCRNGYENGEVEGILDRLNLRKGVQKLSRHPVFQLSKAVKKSAGLGIATQV